MVTKQIRLIALVLATPIQWIRCWVSVFWHTSRTGSWGTGIFANDIAADIRSEYREHLEDQIPDAEATRLVIGSFAYLCDSDLGELWIGLAAAQTEVGRLDPDVQLHAIAAIDGGRGLGTWGKAGPIELEERLEAVKKLRDPLTGPQPSPKKLRRPWRHEETELAAGDVLRHTGPDGLLVLFRVAGIKRSRLGDFPYLEWLNWTGRRTPRPWRLARLKPVRAPATLTMPERPMIYNLTQFRKQDLGREESGFVHGTRLPNWPSEDTLPASFLAGWRALGLLAENHLDPA